MRILFNNIKTLTKISLFSISNLFFFIIGKLIGRRENIVLFGSWMGYRFADNSRFLFQYLHENRTKLGISHVIWVSREKSVVEKLRSMGYEAFRIGTKESTYWHLKAGIHIMCNMSAKSGSYLPDIDVKLSSGAKKVQLWHGVGIKAVGATSNSAKDIPKRSKWVIDFVKTETIRKIGSLGCWAEPKILCTSKLNVSINIGNSKIHEHNAFISGYPRYCDCLAYTEEEMNVIEKIRQYPLVILYLPTFRDNGTSYFHPMESSAFQKFIIDNNILWVEKPHQADKQKWIECSIDNMLYLTPDFDVNVLLKHIDAIVSDYSSAAFDAIYLNKPVVMYVPDLDEYEQGGNGLLFNMREYCNSLLAFDISALTEMIASVENKSYYSKERSEILQRMRLDFFGDRTYEYQDIWSDIKDIITTEK